MKWDRPGIAAWIFPRLGDLLFIGVFVTVIALGSQLLNVDGDLGRHLTLGEYILDTRQIPTTDLFSHTMYGQPLTPHEWLSEVIYALFYRWMGLGGVVLLCGLLIAATFAFSYRLAVKFSRLPLFSFAVTLVGIAASSLHWLARPHLFTLLAVVLWITGIERARNGKTGHWWVMPVGMALWANLHGAFIAGFVIWTLYGLGNLLDMHLKEDSGENRSRFLRFLGLTGLISFLASLLNPAGLALWKTSFGYLQNRYLVGHTGEYLPPDFHQVNAWPFLLMILLSVAIFGLRRGKLPTAHVLLITAWTGMGLISARNIPIYAVVAAPILAEGFVNWLGSRVITGFYQRLEGKYNLMEIRLRGYVWPAVTLIAVSALLWQGLSIDLKRQGNRFDPGVFPVAAVDWLQTYPQDGNVFNYFTWGGYLLHRSWPDMTVFIDGQTDFYGEELTREYEQVITIQDGWETVLERYQVQWAILPHEAVLAKTLQSTPDWHVIYEDPVTLILRRGPSSGE